MEPTEDSWDQATLDSAHPSAPEALAARYETLQELGSGGMGVVYKARDRETGAIVALKVLRPGIATDTAAMERFKAELLLARKITHKNVCRVYELNRFGDVAAISMEYIEGESLRGLLKRVEVLSVGRGLRILDQILAGLQEAHAQGVVHRDLKPENILIARDGAVKVMDFGIARSLEAEATLSGGLTGTPAYMSPEQAEGKSADARSDLYSLGLVMYEMFTGQQVFKGDTAVSLAMKQVKETPPPPRQFEPDLPERIERAILKCLEKNSPQRFQSVEELETALKEKPVPTVAPPAALDEVALPDHLARWQRSDWLLVGLAIAGLGLFFSFFEQTNLVSRSKVAFDRSMLRLKAREYAQRFGASPGKEREIALYPRGTLYDYLAQRVGARAALEMINNPVPAWVWRVSWGNDGWLHLDNQGSLVGFDLPRKSPSGGAPEGLPTEEARPLAERALREIFHRDPALLIEETAVRRPNGTGFGWAERNDYHGLKKRYLVFVTGREIQYLDQWFELPAGYALPNFPAQTLPLVATGFLIAVLGFLQRKQADPVAGWRAAAAIVGFILGGWVGWINLPGDLRIIFSLFSGVAFALLVFFMAVAIERSVARTAPAKLVNLVRLLDRKAAPEPRGIAVLRGTLLGLALLGADTFLIWLGTNHFAMRLDVFKHVSGQAGPFLGSPWPSLLLVLFVLLHVLFVTPPVIFMASFVGRFVRRAAVALLLAATLVAASVAGAPVSLAAVQPYPWKAVLFLIEGLLLVWVYHRFDVLTLHWAVLTFAFWWQNYRQLVMFEPTGAVEQWVAFAVWGTLVLAAAALAFQSSLRVAFRRAVSAFE